MAIDALTPEAAFSSLDRVSLVPTEDSWAGRPGSPVSAALAGSAGFQISAPNRASDHRYVAVCGLADLATARLVWRESRKQRTPAFTRLYGAARCRQDSHEAHRSSYGWRHDYVNHSRTYSRSGFLCLDEGTSFAAQNVVAGTDRVKAASWLRV
jgi:hypothetical protein